MDDRTNSHLLGWTSLTWCIGKTPNSTPTNRSPKNLPSTRPCELACFANSSRDASLLTRATEAMPRNRSAVLWVWEEPQEQRRKEYARAQSCVFVGSRAALLLVRKSTMISASSRLRRGGFFSPRIERRRPKEPMDVSLPSRSSSKVLWIQWGWLSFWTHTSLSSESPTSSGSYARASRNSWRRSVYCI